MKAVGWYAATVVAMVAVVGAVAAAFTAPEKRWVVALSAGVAVGTQTAALLVARAFRKDMVFVGWGLGSLIRLVVLVLFWLVVSRLWRPTVNPALLSLVSMLFVTTVVEPLFLNR